MTPINKKSRSGLAAQKREFANTHLDYIKIPGFGWVRKKTMAVSIAAIVIIYVVLTFGVYGILQLLGRL